MKKGEDKTQEGFTIIEVSLVLAIAGLIFLMVFIALPGLRASQRDSERRENVSMLLESIKKYQTNNRGALPDGIGVAFQGGSGSLVNRSWQNFYNKYLAESFVDPSGNNYRLEVVNCGRQVDQLCDDSAQYDTGSVLFPNDYKMLIVRNATCSGTQTIATSNPRKVAVLYRLERAGVYCSSS